MIRKTLTRTASVFGLSLKGTPFYYADLSDTSIHGEYLGISPIEASRGATLEESITKFALSEDGIYLYTNVPSEDSTLEFKIHYPPAWIFRLQGWGVEHCLSIRQSAQSELAELIFNFSGFSANGVKGDAFMLLGEGVFAVLGVFVRSTGNLYAESSVVKLHESIYEPKKESGKTSHLMPVDLAEARLVMSSGDTSQKAELLKKVGHNLWTGTDQEIRDRLELVKTGLRDRYPEVQIQALDTFVLGGRVVGGVEIVVDFLRQSARQYGISRDDVLLQAIDAAACLLHETYYFNKDVASLETDFDTSDVAAIYDATGGLISPEQYEAINKTTSVEPQLRWTLNHQRALRDALEELGEVNPTILSVGKGDRALEDYPLPVALPAQ